MDHFLPKELTNYKNHRYIDNDTRKAVVAAAVLLSPDVLLGKVIFPMPEGVRSQYTCEFLEIPRTNANGCGYKIGRTPL